MRIPIVKDGWPWIIVPLIIGAVLVWSGVALSGTARSLMLAAGFLGLAVSLFMLYFHRDPVRVSPDGDELIVAGADGVIRRVEYMKEDNYLKQDAVRISIYLNPFNVHTNRTSIRGKVTALAYTPGKHLLTILNEASEHNEHSTIFVENEKISCVMCQIVGPIVRRVVYWLKEEQLVDKGEVIGMMKFGSRLDTYLPADKVNVCVKAGEKVQAGLTVIAQMKK
ncbi:MAG: phosphatidylserine decarboxylase family protein [Spartobacteria bacterium]|nr:phosphatidylserine decarboxylase family protein [Spartobacteria bacterium]